ncbi:aspartate/glutamate racemase family protein [Terrarubrum flagellatum]|uniref:aspartate/glutamate racemase family protein n=1 Tax=Terrirubrum flagellatum TaxID=2895980 RepID=UPI003145680B
MQMKRIGLIGGTSWESTVIYYRLFNERVRDRLGGLHSARLILSSVDMEEMDQHMRAGDWNGLGEKLAEEARRLKRASAEAIILCTNTMHKVADHIRAASDLPFLDIREATGRAIVARGVKRPLLLATRYTMESDFFARRLEADFGLQPVIPNADDRTVIHDVIFNELCRGIVRPEAKAAYLAAVGKAREAGADGVIFGCTEIGMLLSQADLDLPAFDTTPIHVDAALDFAFGGAHALQSAA